MPAYDAERFHPPALMATVVLHNPQVGKSWPGVPMLVDTGADVTLVPSAVITKLELTSSTNQSYQLASFDGTMSLASVVILQLHFCNRIFRGQFQLIDQDWGILGRNVLNGVRLLLDGPGLSWNEHRLR